MAAGDRLRQAAAHVFVDDVGQPVLADDDAHHLGRVLRLRPGEEVTVADGAGRWRPCTWRGDSIEPAGEVAVEPRPAPPVTVGFSLLKGDRTELVVQKLTEVGVDAIVPLVAARTIVRWDAGRAAKQVDRLRRVAREAAMQSRRLWLPQVAAVASLSDALAATGAALAHFGGAAPSLAVPAVLVGPEGGWTDDEVAGAAAVSLGPTVLRAETAAMVAGVLLTSLRGGIVTEPPFPARGAVPS